MEIVLNKEGKKGRGGTETTHLFRGRGGELERDEVSWHQQTRGESVATLLSALAPHDLVHRRAVLAGSLKAAVQLQDIIEVHGAAPWVHAHLQKDRPFHVHCHRLCVVRGIRVRGLYQLRGPPVTPTEHTNTHTHTHASTYPPCEQAGVPQKQ